VPCRHPYPLPFLFVYFLHLLYCSLPHSFLNFLHALAAVFPPSFLHFPLFSSNLTGSRTEKKLPPTTFPI
jgi:hypothetical protein